MLEAYRSGDRYVLVSDRPPAHYGLKAIDEAFASPNPIGQVSDGYHSFDELYEHRHLLLIGLLHELGAVYSLQETKVYTAWRSRLHHDGSKLDGYFIAGFVLPAGDVAYHLPDRLWELTEGIMTLDRAPQWDRHTSLDVLDRLRHWLGGSSFSPTGETTNSTEKSNEQ